MSGCHLTSENVPRCLGMSSFTWRHLQMSSNVSLVHQISQNFSKTQILGPEKAQNAEPEPLHNLPSRRNHRHFRSIPRNSQRRSTKHPRRRRSCSICSKIGSNSSLKISLLQYQCPLFFWRRKFNPGAKAKRF